jgi:hypothetical protein
MNSKYFKLYLSTAAEIFTQGYTYLRQVAHQNSPQKELGNTSYAKDSIL